MSTEHDFRVGLPLTFSGGVMDTRLSFSDSNMPNPQPSSYEKLYIFNKGSLVEHVTLNSRKLAIAIRDVKGVLKLFFSIAIVTKSQFVSVKSSAQPDLGLAYIDNKFYAIGIDDYRGYSNPSKDYFYKMWLKQDEFFHFFFDDVESMLCFEGGKR